MVNQHKILTTIIFLLGLVAITGPLYAATIKATVDRYQLGSGESVRLILEVEGSADGEPDLSVLEKGFEILNRNKSSNMQIINGRISRKMVWTFNLMPKRLGEQIIPAIKFGDDVSNPVKITVSKTKKSNSAAESEDIFLDVDVDTKNIYVQAQVIYTIRLYISVNIQQASLSEPELSHADAVVKKLGEDSKYNTQYKGQNYQVIQRRYAIFPQQSGKLKIKPVIFDGQVALTSRYNRAPFFQNTRSRRIQSDVININVKAAPVLHKDNLWLPARNVQLTEEWPEGKPKFKVGEAITRTVILGADGLTAAQLPEIITADIDGFKTYPDQPVLQDQPKETGIIGIRQEKIAMIATKPGSYILPEIKLAWWNTKTKRKEIARIKKRKITVLPADGNISSSKKSADNPPNSNIGNITLGAGKENNAVDSNNNVTAGFWPWLSLALGVGWLLSLSVVWHRSRNHNLNNTENNDRVATEATLSRKQAEKILKQACCDNNAKAAKVALLMWAKTLSPDKALLSLDALGKYTGGKVAEHISILNQNLYSQSEIDWQGEELWQAIQEYNKNSDKKISKTKETLEPLYHG